MNQEIILSVVAKVARRYKRRCWWADVRDLENEATVAVLLACRTYDSGVGVTFQAYAWRAACRHLSSWCWRNSSPVSETDHNLRDLRGVHHQELDTGMADEGDWTDALLDDLRWHVRVREQLAHLLADDAPVALRALLDEQRPREVAEEFALPVQRVYRIVERARTLMSENALLYSLWKESNAEETEA